MPDKSATSQKLTLHVISHTHWDREWYLSHESFRLRLVDLIDNLIDIMERDPGFKYFHMDGQTIVLEDYLEIRPAKRQRLQKLINDGRILIGPWYLQNDEFLVNGESTVRNMLIGTGLARNQFGVEPMMVGYVPDQFGNVSQLPQIFRGFGIDCSVFGRGFTGPENRSEFIWRSPDGSEVFASHLAQWYNNAQRFPRDPQQTVAMMQDLLKMQEGRAQTSHRLLMNGVDHLEAQENLGDVLRDVAAQEPGFVLIHSTMPEFIERARKELTTPKVHEGEFRQGDEGNVLAGTASSRVYLKKFNFDCQVALQRWAEPFGILAALTGNRYEFRQPLDYAVKLLIQNHPHDSICGCSIDEVHYQMESRFRRVMDVAREVGQRGLAYLAAGVDAGGRPRHSMVTVFNPLPFERDEVVETYIDTLATEDIDSMSLVGGRGESVPMEVLESRPMFKRVLNPKRLPKMLKIVRHRVLVDGGSVPGVGYSTLFLQAKNSGAQAESSEAAEQRARKIAAKYQAKRKTRSRFPKFKGPKIAEIGLALENEFLKASFNGNGSFDLQVKETGRLFRGLHYFEDIGDNGNEYIHVRPKNDAERTTEYIDAEAEVLESSALRQRVRVTYKWKLPKEVDDRTGSRPGRPADYRIVSVFSLAKNARSIDVETSITNNVKDHRLRVLFPTHLHTAESLADSAFDVIRRPFETGVPNRNNTHPMESFFSVNDGKAGLAVFSGGMPEFEVMKRGTTMALTLLRCVDLLGDMPPEMWDREQLVEDYTPDAQCLRDFTFRYGVYPYAGNAETGEVKKMADIFVAPMRVVQTPLERKDWLGGRADSGYFRYFEDEASLLPVPPEDQALSRGLLSVGNPQISLTAVKLPENAKSGERRVVVRLVNTSTSPQEAVLTWGYPVKKATAVRLDEKEIGSLKVEEGQSVTVSFGPKQIRTIEVELQG